MIGNDVYRRIEDAYEDFRWQPVRRHFTSTGYIATVRGSKGELEYLSIADYGKEANVKAKFLGLDKDIAKVEQPVPKPLQSKWVVTLSTQYGCPCKCEFCDVPSVPFEGNATFEDLALQFYTALKEEIDRLTYTERLNVHFARMGEPTFNDNVLFFARWLARCKKEVQWHLGLHIETLHPVVSTMCPKALGTDSLYRFLSSWCLLKNEDFNGQAGLQLSINSTDEKARQRIFGGSAMPLKQIAALMESVAIEPIGRKYCLNFAVMPGCSIDAKLLSSMFSTEDFMVKLTPTHAALRAVSAGLYDYKQYTGDTAWYRAVEDALLDRGFDVLVFVPSVDEEIGRITCGNLVLKTATGEETASDENGAEDCGGVREDVQDV